MRKTWRMVLLVHALITSSISHSSKHPRIYYGGARRGNIGGPLVKIKRLTKYFPERYLNYNIVYILSNAPYLPLTALKVLKKKKVPIILNQNGVYYEGWYEGNWRKQNIILSHPYLNADYIFWQSNFCKKAAETFLGISDSEGEILFNAVDTDRFTPNKKESTGKTFNFLITGKISKHHNYRITSVLHAVSIAIRQFASIQLNIAGWIEDELTIRSLIEELGISHKVKLYGKYSQEEAPYIYQQSDAYITMTYQDNCPSCVIEAMASGLPVIYSASGGIPEIVDSSSGIGIPVKESWENVFCPNSDLIAESMIKIIDKRSEMSHSARSRAEKIFDIKYWIKRHNEVFNQLL